MSLKAEITLSKEQVVEIIKEHLAEKHEKIIVERIELHVDKDFVGSQRDGEYVWSFDKAVCKVEI